MKPIVLQEGVFVYFYRVFHRDEGLRGGPRGPIRCTNFSPGREGEYNKRETGDPKWWLQAILEDEEAELRRQLSLDRDKTHKHQEIKHQVAPCLELLWAHRGESSCNLVGQGDKESGKHLLPRTGDI